MVGRKKTVESIRSKVARFLAGDASQIVVILGRYGFGKTFTLRKLKEGLSDARYLPSGPHKALACFMKALPYKAPSKYQQYIWSQIVEDLGRSSFRHLREQVAEYARLRSVGEEDLLADVDSSFRNALLGVGGPHEDIAWEWLSCYSLSASQQKQIQVNYNIDSDQRALKVLFEMLALLKLLDYEALVMLVDEFEYIFTAGGAKKIQMVVAFKEIFDKVNEALSVTEKRITKIIFLLGCSPGSWDALVKITDDLTQKTGGGGLRPFLDRAEGNEFNLAPLNESETKDMVVTRLRKARLPNANVDSIHPFKSDFFPCLYEATNGAPYLILRDTALVLDKGLEEGEKYLPASFAERVFRSHGLLVTPTPTPEVPKKAPRSKRKRAREVERRVE
jgi:hypothetical protein